MLDVDEDLRALYRETMEENVETPENIELNGDILVDIWTKLDTLIQKQDQATIEQDITHLLDSLAHGPDNTRHMNAFEGLPLNELEKLGNILQNVRLHICVLYMLPSPTNADDDYFFLPSQFLDKYSQSISSPSTHHHPASALKLLLDLNSHRGVLPVGYWLEDVSIQRDIFACGGEAIIQRGSYQTQLIATWQLYTSEDIIWESEAGKEIVKVCVHLYL